MNSDTRLLVVGGLVLAAGLIAAGVLTPTVSAEMQAGLATTSDAIVPDRYTRRRHAHLCQPGDMHRRLMAPHPLYSRPMHASPARTMLSAGGWDWFLNPPSELGG